MNARRLLPLMLAAAAHVAAAQTVSGAASSLPPPVPAPVSTLTPKTENGVTYLCGGVGQEEAELMKQMARDYSLMLTFAARGGAYVADVQVEIADGQGGAVLKTRCDGPIMLVDLPPGGSYRVSAEAGGYTVTRNTRIQAPGEAKALVMSWPMEAVGVERAETLTGGSGAGATAGSDGTR